MNPKNPLLLLAFATTLIGLSTFARAENGVSKTAVRNAGNEPPRAKLKRAMDGLDDVNIGDFRVRE